MWLTRAQITGTNFLLRHVPYESFTIRLDPELRREYVSTGVRHLSASAPSPGRVSHSRVLSICVSDVA
jgi:hypothetical protein